MTRRSDPRTQLPDAGWAARLALALLLLAACPPPPPPPDGGTPLADAATPPDLAPAGLVSTRACASWADCDEPFADGAYLCCAGHCVEVNDANCGACGNACTATETCSWINSSGEQATGCVCASGCTTCESPLQRCADGRCHDVDSGSFLPGDPANCGFCGNACTGPSPYCLNGDCVQCTGPGQMLCADGLCHSGSTDPFDCGACGHACPLGHYCGGGACSPCAVCGTTTCTRLVDDRDNCGACGHSCGANHYCLSGTCVCDHALCPDGTCQDETAAATCGASCTNCQALGEACGNGQCAACGPSTNDACGAGCVDCTKTVGSTCQSGQCTVPCMVSVIGVFPSPVENCWPGTVCLPCGCAAPGDTCAEFPTTPQALQQGTCNPACPTGQTCECAIDGDGCACFANDALPCGWYHGNPFLCPPGYGCGGVFDIGPANDYSAPLCVPP